MTIRTLIFMCVLLYSVTFGIKVNYTDEIFVLFFLYLGFVKCKYRNKIFMLFLFYFAIELSYSLLLKYTPATATVLDSFLMMKPYIIGILAGIGVFALSEIERKKLNAFVKILLCCYLCFIFITAIFEIKIPIGANNVTILFLLYLYLNYKRKNVFNKYFVIAFFCFIAILQVTTQAQSFGVYLFCFILILFFRFIYPYHFGKKMRTKISYFCLVYLSVLLSIGAVIYIAYDDLQFYFLQLNEGFARIAMLLALPQVLDGYFALLGRGFASYGSPPSGMDPAYYSPIYEQVGINNVFGLSVDFPNFLMDVYWATLLGQLGLVGLLLFIAFFVFLLYPHIQLYFLRIHYPKSLLFCSILCCAWIFIFSVGSAYIYNYGVFVLLILGMLRYDALGILKEEKLKSQRSIALWQKQGALV